MRLAALCDDEVRLMGPGEIEIGGLALDSRVVRAGDLFAAMPGTRTDGSRFLAEAVAKGAVAVLGDLQLVSATERPRNAVTRGLRTSHEMASMSGSRVQRPALI